MGDSIQDVMEAVAEKYGAIGVQVAVIQKGSMTNTYSCGWATYGIDTMSVNHRMRIASISKVIIGMETMLLMEHGILDLDDPIGPYWGLDAINPYYPEVPVTIRSLLTHTSSILNLSDNSSRTYDAVRSRLLADGYSCLIPGNISSWDYNNYAYGVLGQTLELAAGANLDTLLHTDLLDAIEADGAFGPGNLKDNSKLVTLAHHDGRVIRTVEEQRKMYAAATPGASGYYFSGGFTISVTDLGKIISVLANKGLYKDIRIMDEKSVQLMQMYDPNQLEDGSYQGIAIRYKEDMYGRAGLYFHTGSAYGVYNFVSYDPLTGDGVVVLTVGASPTKDDCSNYAICGEISNYIYEFIK